MPASMANIQYRVKAEARKPAATSAPIRGLPLKVSTKKAIPLRMQAVSK